MKLKALLRLTYEQRWRGQKDANTSLGNAETVVNILGPDLDAREVTTEKLDTVKTVLRDRGLKPATLNRKLAALSTMLRMAHRRSKIDFVPFIPKEREPEGRLRVITDDELARMSNALPGKHKDCILVLVDTGMRVGELLKLAWEDVEPDAVHIKDTKGRRPRMVPLTSRAKQSLTAWVDTPHGPFRDITYSGLSHRWDKAKAATGLKDDKEFVIHALRHTCASRLVRRGVAIQVVKEVLGHRNITTTLRYAHLDQSSLRAAMEVLEQ